MTAIKYYPVLTILLFIVLVVATSALAGTKLNLNVQDRIEVTTIGVITNRVSGLRSDKVRGYFAAFENDTLSISTKGDFRLSRVVRTDQSIVEFPGVGARYNAASESISGTDIDGNEITIPSSEIEYVDVTININQKQVNTTFTPTLLHNRLNSVSDHSYPIILHEIPLHSIYRIKKFHKGSSIPIVLGILAGGGIGYMIGDANAKEPSPRGFLDFSIKLSRDTKIAIDAGLGMLVGGTIGYIIGRSRWSNVPFNRGSLRIKPTSRIGMGLTLAVKF